MSRFFWFLTLLVISVTFLFACNNDSDSSSVNKDSANAKAFVWTQQDHNEFLQDCIEGVKAKYSYGEDTAFTICNCALKELQIKFPSYDSANAVLQQDTARAAAYLKNCLGTPVKAGSN